MTRGDLDSWFKAPPTIIGAGVCSCVASLAYSIVLGEGLLVMAARLIVACAFSAILAMLWRWLRGDA